MAKEGLSALCGGGAVRTMTGSERVAFVFLP